MIDRSESQLIKLEERNRKTPKQTKLPDPTPTPIEAVKKQVAAR